MSRILFWIVLFGAGYWFWRRARTAVRAAATQAASRTSAGPGRTSGTPQLAEPMVRCAYCGAHSPRSDSVELYRLNFCNADHASAFAKRKRADEPA